MKCLDIEHSCSRPLCELGNVNIPLNVVFLPSPFFPFLSVFILGLTAYPDAPLYKSDSSAILIYCSL